MAKNCVEHTQNHLGEENCCAGVGSLVDESRHINEILKKALKVMNNHRMDPQEGLDKKGP